MMRAPEPIRPAQKAAELSAESMPRVPAGGMSDRRMEQVMGRLLQAGVTLAAAVVLAGGVLFIRAQAGVRVSYGSFHAETAGRWTPAATLTGAARGEPAAVIQLGVLLLIATPVARVIFAAIAFAMQRDGLYLTISMAVLLVLLLGLFHVV